ncbi:glycosyltransferase [Paenibacillus aurantius]|uniref:Glycosyltransferase n=1 Tax=Paenibacillus aurantius TaxID=2918900 RepID=A0AA96LG66_9BACL|nr:glycosyltransferase [Paenibacillus aurantius]WNQ12698.1 glycosyltransferase [Paenibacillus aurantius]
MKPKVSIVVPIYNMEPYLARCLDSLLAQTLKPIEILAVNDGSTDSTGALLREYAERDPRIVVLEQENAGVSAARNRGIEAAQGDYIGFVDPDDWVEPDMYAEMLGAAVGDGADIVMCTYTREFGTHSKEKVFDLPAKVTYAREELRETVMRRLVGPLKEELAQPDYLDAWGTVWSKLYRSDLLKDNVLEFVDLHLVGTNEDSLFNIHAFYHAEKFVMLNKPFYHYWRANASSVTSGYKPDLKDQWFRLYGMIEGFLNENGLPASYYEALNNRICLNTLGLGLNTVGAGNTAAAVAKVRKLNDILNDERIQEAFRAFEMAYCPAVWRTFYLCAKLRFAAGFYVMLVTMERLRKIVK